MLAYRTDGLVEVAQNIRADDPEAVRSMTQSAMRFALFVLAAVSATLVATDLVRLFRR